MRSCACALTDCSPPKIHRYDEKKESAIAFLKAVVYYASLGDATAHVMTDNVLLQIFANAISASSVSGQAYTRQRRRHQHDGANP
ncbi:hypothetical protein NKL07_02150 [Mesorhizobium sp. C280B]|uniref:hypothetical protein n=1 Tax=unclassified Mesorhizobium TaxID=325217 RepID=UPI0003CF5323|nr:hypothetical protein [Mesorhizobium sp. LSJC280B00]ESW64921.1 hypothetical protein X772_35725 [Mesorhizobium sp. LSJC280B00]